MKRAVLFDLDETLLTHDAAIRSAAGALIKSVCPDLDDDAQRQFEELWISLNQSWYAKFFNREISFREASEGKLHEALATHGIALANQQTDDLLRDYFHAYQANCLMYDDVVPCLKQLSSWPLGIVTNGETQQQAIKIEHSGLSNYIHTVVTSEQAGIAKPDAKIFHVACQHLAIDPSDVVFIGDNRQLDAIASSATGMRGIWLNRSNSARDSRVETIGSLNELPGLLQI